MMNTTTETTRISVKRKSNNWSDVRAVVATIAVVTTLALWNVFAEPEKSDLLNSANNPDETPPTETPEPVLRGQTELPQVKIMFTQVAPPVYTAPQPKGPKKNKNNNNGGGGSVTQTKSS